ncbi:MAG: acyl-CoA dehydratase activase [bacterium]|nr:acyl-CoA dehydratase activase [bacterium]
MHSDFPFIGVDVGSASVKLAALASAETARRLTDGCPRLFAPEGAHGPGGMTIVLSRWERHGGDPPGTVSALLEGIRSAMGGLDPGRARLTGSGGREAAAALGALSVNEFRAAAEGMNLLHPEVRTVLEMGGASAKIIRTVRDADGSVRIEDYETNGECAAGTGLFFDQQVERLEIRVEDVTALVRAGRRSAAVAGRCSVFAKSDMIHAQQRGYLPPEILKGLCEAVARNFKGTLVKGRTLEPPVAFIGGVSENGGVAEALRLLLGLGDGNWIVPPLGRWAAAVGAAEIARRLESVPRSGFRVPSSEKTITGFNSRVRNQESRLSNPESGTRNPEPTYPTTSPLSMDKVVLLRDRIQPFRFPDSGTVPAYLGIDVGSVSTNLALITESGELIHGIYTMTRGRPVEVVTESLADMEAAVGGRVRVLGLGTTGSGRDLIGLLAGADAVKDEITAHKTGAVHVGRTLLDRRVDTIFEIGGQDSKFISLRDGTVTDFCLNEACAAGTGSFLEEQARQIGVAIKDEFAALALASRHPLRIGERCTVFMAKEIVPYLQKGVPREDLIAGLALSVAQNYLNRVVKKRPIGETVFFQGGTAYNDAVAAAFATVLDREIVVPPHNGILGAIGAALLAAASRSGGKPTAFRGWQLDRVPRSLREFTCRACSNHCTVEEFTVAGEKSYWGDKCSEKYRRRTKTERKPVLPNLIRVRDRQLEPFRKPAAAGPAVRGRAGIPMALHFHDRLPFWKTYLESIGFECVFSGHTDPDVAAAGVEACVNEPCFPVQAAHGHFVRLMAENPDILFFPHVVNEEDPLESVASFLCPWVQTFPLIAKHVSVLEPVRDRIFCPTVAFREGRAGVEERLFSAVSGLGVSRAENQGAVAAAYAAQAEFRDFLRRKGEFSLKVIRESGAPAVILIGRPYNVYDPGMNLNVPVKLAELYGANVLPMDFLPLDGVDIKPVHDHMFWNYGRRILQAARWSRDLPNSHLIYLSNFKCGPDSYIRHYVEEAAGKPFLFLQFDSHSNDAGIMTRVEAFLESRGLL